MICNEKSEFGHRELLQKTIYGELQNLVKILFEHCCQLIVGNNNHFLSLVFNQPRCHGNSTNLN